ncbi:RNA methyltransferase [Tenacibaculum sp. IB213877]|uniref:TrmH family RNA methyltransferase n=1 Tax=Tenacibaculum sp. IB213877 TaxID=3097351 RepID=UPI002A5A5CBC|nr:RNA methyltransferase [Tenacibaculum sp. IB213877]MDY0781602.1 RNA methyltransferase [Tenacibaculum sp. IB213877]
MSLSKNQQKLILGLQQKKNRNKHNLFVAEGIKVINELLKSSLEIDAIFTTDDFLPDIPSNKITRVSEQELKKISSLKTPNKVLGLFKIPEEKKPQTKGLIIALDEINDPGNLGTIIRLCDWFGVKQLVCSKNTVDCYNQKVVQSTMGSITRVQINYLDLSEYVKTTTLPVFTADMDGKNVYKSQLPTEAVLVMGNEANGISDEINELVNNKLTIPRFGDLQQTESLNVATATSILLSEFKRSLE